jgi:CO dehydrogenase maturation factor
MEAMLKDEVGKMGAELIGMIPHDDNVLEYNLTGKPLLELPSNSPALLAARDILGRIELLN